MIRLPILLLLLILYINAQAQFEDDFRIGVGPDTVFWKGDTDHFVINSGMQLQLNAPEAGSSFIWRKTNIPDSVEFHLFFKMNFSPSSNNLLRVFLQIDTFDLDLASGYYFEIGENGSEDKISFIRIIDGIPLTLAEGSPGIFSSSPASAAVKIKKNAEGVWNVALKLDGDDYYREELEIFDSTIKRYFDQYFGIQCVYTSTRVDKFIFDDIYLKESEADVRPPQVVLHRVLSDDRLVLHFDEVVDKSSVYNANQYDLDVSGNKVETAIFNEFQPLKVELSLANPLESGPLYVMKLNGIKDLYGNEMRDTSLFMYLAVKPMPGELLINEVLFDPYPESHDFIELYNNSDRILSLNSLVIQNFSRNEDFEVLYVEYDLFPSAYLAISSDTLTLKQIYEPEYGSGFMEHKLPALNNDAGNVTIMNSLNGDFHIIDSFDYSEDMHFELLNDAEGYSLERLSFEQDSNDPDNWTSSSSLNNGASPGYKNSQAINNSILQQEKYFELSNQLFSPNNDGYEDQLIINYKLPKEDFLATIKIFNLSGNFIKELCNNESLGRSGILVWNGLGNSGEELLLGPYIILINTFHPEGRVYSQKLLAYLVEEL